MTERDSTTLQYSSPAEEPYQFAAMTNSKPKESYRGDLGSVEEMALRTTHPVCLDPPAQERRVPGGQQKRPGQSKRDP